MKWQVLFIDFKHFFIRAGDFDTHFIKNVFALFFISFQNMRIRSKILLTNSLSKYDFYHSLLQLSFFIIPVLYLPDTHFGFFGSLLYLILSLVSPVYGYYYNITKKGRNISLQTWKCMAIDKWYHTVSSPTLFRAWEYKKTQLLRNFFPKSDCTSS